MVVNTYYKSKLIYSLVTACFFAYSSLAVAQVYEFTYLFTGSQNYEAMDSYKSTSFAQLAAPDSGGAVWRPELSIKNKLFGSFEDEAYIGSMSFDFTSDPKLQPISIAGNTAGAVSVSRTRGAAQSGLTDIDLGFQFGQGGRNRLYKSDWVKWSNSGLNPNSSLTSKFLHLQGIDDNYSAKSKPIIAYPVSEPETYTMLLAGLGLIGFTARRRKQNGKD
jgi:hypothetical protein